jgi:RNA polymerase sigma factor (sigma-70 family)
LGDKRTLCVRGVDCSQSSGILRAMGRLPDYFLRLQRMLIRRGRTREEAEDLVQQAFLKLQEYCNGGGLVRKTEPFLVRTVLRLAVNARRDEHRDLYVDEKIESIAQIVDTHPTPDEVCAHDECLHRMRAVLNGLSVRTRTVFSMHRFDGLSYAQIAQHLGLSVSAIEKHIASALAALAEVNDEE